jgi:hypothetical protein
VFAKKKICSVGAATMRAPQKKMCASQTHTDFFCGARMVAAPTEQNLCVQPGCAHCSSEPLSGKLLL